MLTNGKLFAEFLCCEQLAGGDGHAVTCSEHGDGDRGVRLGSTRAARH